MASPYQLAKQFRAALLAGDDARSARLLEAYRPVAATLRRELDTLFANIVAAQARGETIDQRWINKSNRLNALLAQIQAAVEGYGHAVLAPEVSAGQRQNIQNAQSFNRQMVDIQKPDNASAWNAVPADAVESAVGYMGDGTQIGDYFAQIAAKYYSAAPADSPDSLRQVLISGIARGKSPRQIAKDANRSVGIGLDRALTISRTETLRAYRTASTASYQANRDVVLKWRWTATLSGRTCPTCLAMHGTLHNVDEEFGSHVNCRCVQVPVTENYIDEDFPSGEEWLKNQPAKVVLEVFQFQGPEAALAFHRGKVALSDFVHKFEDPVWGTVRTTKSLKQAQQK